MTQQVMSKEEGFAIHHQLDAMVKALEPYDNAAVEAGDADVTALLARLYGAREAALKIACRRPLAAQGVSLAKS